MLENYSLDYREFKISLRVDHPESYRAYWELVKNLADRNKFKVEESYKPFHERHHDTCYLDTPDHALESNGYLLRKRTRYDLGKPLPAYCLTLKFRDTDPEKVFGIDLKATRGVEKEDKIENDINFFPTTERKHLLSHHETGVKEMFSHDNSIFLEEASPKTFGEIVKIFPGLKKLNCPLTTPLEIVNNLIVDEHVATPGLLDPGRGSLGEVTFSAWYDKKNGNPLLAEFSCRRKAREHERRAHRFRNFFEKLRTYAPEWLAKTTTTKARFVYEWREW